MTANPQRSPLPLSSKWLPAFLSPPEMTSDEERQAEGTLSIDRIISEVHDSIRSHYRALIPVPKPPNPPPASLSEQEKYNELVLVRDRREQDLCKLTELLSSLRLESDMLSSTEPEVEYNALSSHLSDLRNKVESLKHDDWTCEAMLSRGQTNNSVLYARTNRLKVAFTSLSTQLETALNVIQIDENWTLSFTQQREMIENGITNMRKKRLETLAEILNLAEKTRNEVNDGKANLIRERIRRVKGEDRREKLREQIRYAKEMAEKAKEMKENTKKQLKVYQDRSDRFEKAFKTRDPSEISRKFKDMIIGNDILQKNIEEMLVNETKLKQEYTKMRIDLSKLILTHRKTLISPKKLPNLSYLSSRSLPSPSDPVFLESFDSMYHWLNNLCGLLLRVSRLDSYTLLGPTVPIVLLYSTEATRVKCFDYGKQTAKICLLLEKKLVTAMEIVQQRGKTKARKKKTTYTQVLQSMGTDERLRMKIIAEQHFIQNPPASIQSLIGSYASAIQKEISSKPLSLDPKFPRPVATKLIDRAQSEIEMRETEFLLSGQMTAKARKSILPFIEVGEKQRGETGKTERGVNYTPRPRMQRDIAGELRDYVTSRTQQMRKSASTEGLVDFLRDLQIRKRDLAHFIDKHRTHIRAFSQNTEAEGTLKKTVSSMASTNTSARRMVKSNKISPAKKPA